MFPDTHILERRLRQLQRLHWPISAATIMRMCEADFDALDMAADADAWWRVLRQIVERLDDNDERVA